ncbi:DUF302 domain-containing protein [Sulfuriflexus mobilis]|uniref:DUF302 domain-containing protein n=1 Tax=Sulfuriflexus mobilis TaxID=1811807 RepID=UPI000F8196DC|nr:DUF302 domain-containing protein [Sulfuriflexus mobilis]
MSIVGRLFALIGFIVVLAGMIGAIYFKDEIRAAQSFDEKAGSVYLDMMKTVLKTGNAAEATVWRVPLTDGVSPKDAEEAMRAVANEYNIKNVGELPLSQQVEVMIGKPYRTLKIYMFCDPLTAVKMLDFSDAFSAYLPCRVAMVEDKQGKVWLYSLNMDLMIHGGTPLPPALKAEAEKVKDTILAIMHRGAAGDF